MNILLSSVGRRTYMVNYFKEALEGKGLVHAANSEGTYSLSLADKSVITPLIYNTQYIDFLLNYCVENEIEAIIPLFDIDLPVLAKNRYKFSKNGINVIVSSFDFIEICNDKWKTYKFLERNGFNVPATFLSVKDALIAIENRTIKFPLITKPRWGMGSIGVFQADDINELQILYQKVKKSISESYLKFESAMVKDGEVVIQEKIDGQEYGMDIFNDLEGNFMACVPQKKLERRAGETYIAEVVDDFDLIDLGKKLSNKTNHIGNLDLDLFRANDKLYVLEMNGRFGGQYPFSYLSGVNLHKILVNILLHEKVDKELLLLKRGAVGIKDLLPVRFSEDGRYMKTEF